MITGKRPSPAGRNTLTRNVVPLRTRTGTSHSTSIPAGALVTVTFGRIALATRRHARDHAVDVGRFMPGTPLAPGRRSLSDVDARHRERRRHRLQPVLEGEILAREVHRVTRHFGP